MREDDFSQCDADNILFPLTLYVLPCSVSFRLSVVWHQFGKPAFAEGFTEFSSFLLLHKWNTKKRYQIFSMTDSMAIHEELIYLYISGHHRWSRPHNVIKCLVCVYLCDRYIYTNNMRVHIIFDFSCCAHYTNQPINSGGAHCGSLSLYYAFRLSIFKSVAI